MEQCIPRATLPKRHNLPWLNKKIIQAIRKRNLLYKNWRKSGATTVFAKYKRARNNVTYLLRKAKKNFFTSLDPADKKKFWKIVKHINTYKPSVPDLSLGDLCATTNEEKANMLNNFFATCFNEAQSPLTPDDTLGFELNGDCPEVLLCTEEEVICLLHSLDITKSTGLDGISARMLKATAACIAPSLTNLLNMSIRSGQFPQPWKSSLITPIPKSSERSSPSNYRPISLLSIVSKLLERHFHSLITEHLSDIHYPFDQQWGFQPKKSTTTSLLLTLHDWLQHVDNGKEVCAVFFDLKKAFDSVPHRALMSKLVQLGLDNYILR